MKPLGPVNTYVPGEIPTDWSISLAPRDWGVVLTLSRKVNGEWSEASAVDFGAAGGFYRRFRLYGTPDPVLALRTDPEAKAVIAHLADREKAYLETNEMAYMAATKAAIEQRETFKASLEIALGEKAVTSDERIEILQKVLNMSSEDLGRFLDLLQKANK